MNTSIIENLKDIVGSCNLKYGKGSIENYLTDETAESVRPQPNTDVVVVKPATAKEVSQILKLANETKIPVIPRGGGTGLVGGVIPLESSIILLFERMNRIEIDRENLFAVAEAGVTFEQLLRSTDEAGLSFPPHPGDESAQLGALAVMNAGGARALRYGVMRNHVKGMEIVLPSGDTLSLGGKLLKNNVGYDLMQLIMGSEGTLAIVTKVVLRLYPKLASTATLIVPFDDRRQAISTVPRILQNGRLPLAIEYVEKELMEKTAKHIGTVWPGKEGKFFLIIIEAESNDDQVIDESMRVSEICKANGAQEPLFAQPREDQEKILKIRSNVYCALKSETADILDVTVPPADIGRLIERVDEIGKKYDAYLPAYGHAGDGNLHVHILKKDAEHIDEIRTEIYTAAVSLKGVITGEHGIGKVRIDSFYAYSDSREIELMRRIKSVFDPNDILNPGTKLRTSSL